MAEVNDEREQSAKRDNERTVTVSGIPLLIAGFAAFVSVRWLRRRFGRAEDSAP